MLNHDEMLAAWTRDGFFFARALVPERTVGNLTEELIGQIRRDPPAAHPGTAPCVFP